MTRGALTTFSIANDVAKYFAIIPAMFAVIYPQLLFAVRLGSAEPSNTAFIGQVALWLWLSLLAVSAGVATAEASTLARARRLRALQSDIPAKCLIMPHDPREDWLYETVTSETLDVGDVVLVQAGDVIPVDGEVIEGVAEVDNPGNGQIRPGHPRERRRSLRGIRWHTGTVGLAQGQSDRGSAPRHLRPDE